MRLKMGATFALLVAILLGVLNTYPIMASRDLVIDSKESSMQSRASVMSSSLSALELLTAEAVGQVMELVDVMPLTRVIVTDQAGLVLYDTSNDDESVGRYALLSEIAEALEGQIVFYGAYTDGVFNSREAMPIVRNGTVMGAVYLYEYDTEQGDIILGLQRNLRNISFAVAGIGFCLIILFTTTLTRRIKRLASAVGVVSSGDYAYRIKVRGSDEIAELSDEFNILTRRLESTEEARRRFVSDASHELRTPLAAIRLLSDSITQSESMQPAVMREFATDIGSEAERLQRTTEKLMNLTRLDAGLTIAGRRERTDLCAAARRTLHLLEPLAAAQNVTIVTALAEDCFVMASADDLYQIVFNLVENGIKYNRPGGQVFLRLQREKNQVCLTVEDTGIGIPPEDMESVFERFYRVDKARSRASGGSGLGLAIVHDAVCANEGTVEVAARGEGGTRFTVVFPYEEDRA